ncbi:MAG: hypothetical protein H7X88_01670 [Gloeobacteraceae cyanobacterium ES-bin-316]|nr:hypothetical protein [Ferruginibacter sp.]
MNIIDTKIDLIKKNLIDNGNYMWDENLQRFVHEILGSQVELNYLDMFALHKVPLNKKYQPEIKDMDKWYKDNLSIINKHKHRRQIVYFNDTDFKKRMQCISLFQRIDTTLIIYQRSGDTAKMLDDFNFFTYIAYQYFSDVINTIKIFYGSLHTETETGN